MRTVIVTENSQLGPSLRELVERAAPGQHEVALANFSSATTLVAERKPDAVLLDVSASPREALQCARRLRREMPDLLLAAVGARGGEEEMLQAMHAGAREYLCQPVTLEAIRDLLGVLEGMSGAAGGTLTAVFSNKGGSGVTTIAANVAVELAEMSSKLVAAADLVLGHGDLALFLDLEPRYTVVDIAANVHRLDSSFLMGSLAHHSERLFVMAAPKRPEEGARIGARELSAVVDRLRMSFGHVVLDAGHELDERTMGALDACDNLLFVVVPSVASLRNAERCIGLFQRLGYGGDKVKLVINRVANRGSITVKMITEALGMQPVAQLPDQPAVASEASDRGIALSKAAPRSALLRSVRGLAEELYRSNGHAGDK